jgi:hypothetical protein
MKNEENEIKSEGDRLDFTRPDFTYIPKNHEWKQYGYYIICKSCPIEHASHIGSGKILVGIDVQGMPKFKTRKELGL